MISPRTARLIELALEEDLGPGDVTSLVLVPAGRLARATIVARQPLVVSGLEVAVAVFSRVDPGVLFEPIASEGDAVRPGRAVARVAGRAQGLLAAERTALNFLRHLSGIATYTRRFVKALAGTRCALLDTRKTTPGLRELEKAAVRAGGGRNHRLGLFDGILIKDNHLASVGSVRRAVERARQAPFTLRVEVECATISQVREALAAGVDIIMLDNMSLGEMARAVKLVAGRAQLEASGNITLENVRRVAECGVDFVSVGAITHGAPDADLALEFSGR